MFFGTTPSIVSQYLHREFQKHTYNEGWVPFAGNFIVEQLFQKAQPGKVIHSTDVSLYSRGIGFGLTNQPMKLKLTAEMAEHFPTLARDDMSPVENAALTVFMTEVAQTWAKRKHDYYLGLFEDAKSNVGPYFEKILSRVEQMAAEMKDLKFYGCDACEILPDVKEGDLVFYDPPYWLGGYEKMFEALENALEFDTVKFTEIDNDLKNEQLKELNEKGAIVYYRTNEPEEAPANYTEVFRHWYKWSNHYYVYANRYHEKFVGRFKPIREKVQNIPIIGKEDVITPESKVEIINVGVQVGNHYRLMWTKKAQMTNGERCYLILIDGKLIGQIQLQSGLAFGTDLSLIVSDPAAPTSQYKRLGKLVLMLTCNDELMKRFNDETMWQHNGFTTSVFTNHAASMKYRGLFKLNSRKEDQDGDYKYRLIYHNRKLFKTAKDGLKEWCKRFGKND